MISRKGKPRRKNILKCIIKSCGLGISQILPLTFKADSKRGVQCWTPRPISCLPWQRISFNDIDEIVDARNRTGHTESKLEVLVMMSKMVFLHCPHVRRKLGMVQTVWRRYIISGMRKFAGELLTHSACSHIKCLRSFDEFTYNYINDYATHKTQKSRR